MYISFFAERTEVIIVTERASKSSAVEGAGGLGLMV